MDDAANQLVAVAAKIRIHNFVLYFQRKNQGRAVARINPHTLRRQAEMNNYELATKQAQRRNSRQLRLMAADDSEFQRSAAAPACDLARPRPSEKLRTDPPPDSDPDSKPSIPEMSHHPRSLPPDQANPPAPCPLALSAASCHRHRATHQSSLSAESTAKCSQPDWPVPRNLYARVPESLTPPGTPFQ